MKEGLKYFNKMYYGTLSVVGAGFVIGTKSQTVSALSFLPLYEIVIDPFQGDMLFSGSYFGSLTEHVYMLQKTLFISYCPYDSL